MSKIDFLVILVWKVLAGGPKLPCILALAVSRREEIEGISREYHFGGGKLWIM